MNIRRPVAGLFIALTLVGGPATLSACGSPNGLDRNDGDSSDNDTGNTSGNNPADVSQGGVPSNDSAENSANQSRDANENGDNN